MITTLLMLKCLVALVIPLAVCSVMLLLVVCTNWGKQHIHGCARVGKFLFHASLIVSAVGLTLIVTVNLLTKYLF